jgi:hypothetical protein
MVAAQGRTSNPYDDPARITCVTDMNQAQQTPAAQSYQSFDEATKNMQAQELEREQERQMQQAQDKGMSR